MATSVGALRVDLSANSAQFDRDLGAARSSLGSFGRGVQNIGTLAGESGEVLARGLKRGVRDIAEVGQALGAAGGEAAKFAGQLADLALTGFNPVSLAVAGLGFLLGALHTDAKETFEVKIPDSTKKTIEAVKGLDAELADLQIQLNALFKGNDFGDEKLNQQIRDQERVVEGLRSQAVERKRAADEIDRLKGNIEDAKKGGLGDDDGFIKRQRELITLEYERLLQANAILIPEENELENLRWKLRLLGQIQRKRDEEDNVVDELDRREARAANNRLEWAGRYQEVLDDQAAAEKKSADAWQQTLDRGAANGRLIKAITEEQKEFNAAQLKAIETRKKIDAMARDVGEGANDAANGARWKREKDLDDALMDLRRSGLTKQKDLVAAAANDEIRALDDKCSKELDIVGLSEEDRLRVIQEAEAAKMRVRANASREAALHGDSLSEGFSAQASKAQDDLDSLGRAGADVYTGLRQGFGDFGVSASQDFRDVGRVALQVMNDIEARLIRLGTNTIFDSIFAPAKPAPGGTANGAGTGAPGTSGGVPVMSPGAVEKRAAAGDTHIHNYSSGATVSAQRKMGPSSDELHMFVRDAVRADLARGGEISQDLERKFGLRRQGRQRG